MDLPDWKSPTPKERQLNKALLAKTTGLVNKLLGRLLTDKEINLYHSYANVVSIRRLGYNDHGPVHARITTYNSLRILDLLHESGVETSLEEENVGTMEDSALAITLGCFLHDTGMGVTRDQHEWHSITLADQFIVSYLKWIFPDDLARQIVLRSMAHEIIVGHMAHTRIHSVEAGIVLVADGTDMTRGRSRIPLNLELDPSVGDMHRYSANTITRLDIEKGENKPVRLVIKMDNATGLFQIEEVLMTKVKASPIMKHLEIIAEVGDEPPKFYLR